MTVLGLPLPMFLVFAATVLAGSLGAIHYVVFHVVLRRPFADEGHPLEVRDPSGRTATKRPGGGGRIGRNGEPPGAGGLGSPPHG